MFNELALLINQDPFLPAQKGRFWASVVHLWQFDRNRQLENRAGLKASVERSTFSLIQEDYWSGVLIIPAYIYDSFSFKYVVASFEHPSSEEA